MNLTRDIQVAGPHRLGETALHLVSLMLRIAQHAGHIPHDRAALDSDSEMLWIDDTAMKIVAVATFFDAGNGRLWLDFLYTDEPLRNRGLGRALLRRLAEVAKDRGFKRIIFGTHTNNAAMRHLAQRAGFVEEGVQLGIEIKGGAA